MSADDPTRDMARGVEAPQGTPGAGENVCPSCGRHARHGGNRLPQLRRLG